MKFFFYFLIILLISLIISGCSKPQEGLAKQPALNIDNVECPSGFVDSPSPGCCGLYQDKNNNSICDKSE